MPRVGFIPRIPAFERAKVVYALDIGHYDWPVRCVQFSKWRCFVWNLWVRLAVHGRAELQNSG
jgi:hypothetical protein